MNTTDSKKPTNSKASTAKQEEREFWHKIVVKVLKWKESSKCEEKITSKEWSFYHKSSIKINVTIEKGVMLKRLKEIKEQIEKNGGFEEKI